MLMLQLSKNLSCERRVPFVLLRSARALVYLTRNVYHCVTEGTLSSLPIRSMTADVLVLGSTRSYLRMVG